MSTETCTAAAFATTSWWEQLVARHGTWTCGAAALAVALAASWALRGLWTAWNISYHLRLLCEHALVAVPDIVLDDLPASVTRDDDDDDGIISTKEPDDDDTQSPKKQKKKKKKMAMDAVQGQIQCHDPSTGQYLGHVSAMTARDVHELCAKAAAAQREWQRTTFAQRRRVLRTLQKYICHNVEAICRVAARDSGKPVVDACLGEVLTTCEKIRTVCASGELWLRPDRRAVGPMFLHKHAAVEYVPLGVLAPIAPWNYPCVTIKLCHYCVLVLFLLSLWDYCFSRSHGFERNCLFPHTVPTSHFSSLPKNKQTPQFLSQRIVSTIS